MSLFAFDEEIAKTYREAGFTTAHVVPQDGVFRGQSAVLNLEASSLGDNLLARQVSQYAAFDPAKEEGFGNSLMGAVTLFRQTILDAKWYGEARAAFDSGKTHRRVPFDRSLEALSLAAAGDQPVLFEASSLLDVLRAGRISGELGLQAWVVGTGKEYQRLTAVKDTGMPVLLPLVFPETPEVGKDGDDLTISLEDLRHWDSAPDNCLDLLDAGVPVAFTSTGLEAPKKIYPSLATAVERGLKAEEALAALTTTPATLLGVDHLVGTLTAGKLANLIVVDGDLFRKKPKLLEVWVDGRRHEIDERKESTLDPAGSWRLTYLVGDEGGHSLDLMLHGEADSLAGEITSAEDTWPLTSALLEDDTLEITYETTDGTVNLLLELRENRAKGLRAKGHGQGPEGSFAVQGRKDVPDEASSEAPSSPSDPETSKSHLDQGEVR